ncbi:BatA domain-containing protein [Luteolibacter algae]|uniref:BatA domain-containing protein n=1 Tax=Luteolibacter algae TaxID=454151 RepID=A0ABW5DEL3_9BACT
MFANPYGLLALLAIPVILAIHFLQRKSITLPVSTLFLLERTQREATSGRRFERFIPSVPLWMQLLAILLLTWFLVEPRFKKENSVHRVAIVVDSSASMSVFKSAAVDALRQTLPGLQGIAATMELTLLPSVPNSARLYSGSSPEALLGVLENYEHHTGVIDPSYALRLARSIVSGDGTVIYLTDTPSEGLPYEARLISVGEPTPNVGFTGITFEEKQGALTFQAIIRNYDKVPASRKWSLLSSAGRTEPRAFEIDPNSFVTIQADFPIDAQDVRLSLTPDGFTLDDTLPLIAPKPKSLDIFTAVSPGLKGLSDKLLRSLNAAKASNDITSSDLVITSYDPLDPAIPETNAILFVEDPTSQGKYLKGGILAEAHPLMDGVNWQALLVRETLELPRLPSDRVLLWQEKRPLIFLRENAGRQILCFNFDLRLSNAVQQPAFIVLLHRFAEGIRAKKIAPEHLNLETGQRLNLATIKAAPVEINATDLKGRELGPPGENRAPPVPGFLTISQNGDPLLKAAVHFADTREADLTSCAPGEISEITTAASLELHTGPDPFKRLWLLLLLPVLCTAWFFTSRKTSLRQPDVLAS